MIISTFYDHILQAKEQSKKELPELLNYVKACGISAVEINLKYLLEHEETLFLLRDAGLKISCIYETHDLLNKNDIESAKKHIDFAEQTGTRRILIIPGYFEQDQAHQFDNALNYENVAKLMEKSQAVQRAKNSLVQICQYAQKTNVLVTFEDYDYWTSPCSHMLQLLWWFKNVPGLYHTFDMGNYAYSQEDVEEAFELLKDYIVHVHCKDRGPELACVPTGGGLLPIADLVQKLKKQGYQDYFAIEHFDAPNQIEYLKKSADFLKGL